MDKQQFNQGLMSFLDSSPTPFHAVSAMVAKLSEAGFKRLFESEPWKLQPGGRYFVTRNGSSIIAFSVGNSSLVENGLRLIGAHTDSPCLRVKPNPELTGQGYLRLGVEVYGGVLLNPWFDRDLSMAGKVVWRDGAGQVRSGLVNFKRPVAIIPSLAIHLDREANSKRTVNPQTDIPPVIQLLEQGESSKEDSTRSVAPRDFSAILGDQVEVDNPGADVASILHHELSLFDTQRAALVGYREEFIASARLDNLLSCHAGLQALLDSGEDQTVLLVCTDHEEVGSTSAIGAQGPMLQSVLERLLPDTEARSRAIAASLLISADNAHGVHPNYAAKHDGNHWPILNRGPVLKINANQRYATNSESGGLFRDICHEAGVPLQSFVNRTDLGCGSTIGPLTAAAVGVNTLDVGVPTFAMHSIRELAGSDDAFGLYQALQGFCARPVVHIRS